VAQEGDPRYLGYAQAALGPWWKMDNPPDDIQVMRAALRQFNHDFDGALADLDRVLERSPANAQARSLRATIHFVQARYPAARADCQVLLQDPGNALAATGCVATVDGLTGQVARAYQTLSTALAANPAALPETRLWAMTRLAEMAQRRGRNTQAERHFRQALALGITDTFLLAAYADFLLDQRRPAEVVTLLKNRLPSDGLLLRLALAEKVLKLSSAGQRADILKARFDAADLRGDTVHQQEQARFELFIHEDAKKALGLAQSNWKVQREPPDARIFLEAALAARDLAAARPVIDWLASSNIEDGRLIGLAQQLKGAVR
jgi:predicted Zn-dependent protease